VKTQALCAQVPRVVLPFAALSTLSTGCKLTEIVTGPPGESTVIAQMVLNTEASVQRLWLERSDRGTFSFALSPATVRLTHLNPDASCARPTVTLTEASDSTVYGRDVERRRVYQTTELCALHAGDRVELRVETPQGEVVTGTTQIPGANRLLVKAGSVSALAPQVLWLDRTRDSIHIELDPRFARGIQIEAVRKGGNPPQNSDSPTSPVFDITTDALRATIAGSLLNPFEEDADRRTIFRAGAAYLFSIAPTDTNYFDFVRSGTNPFTGRGFINYLSGGIGVFGSVAPQTYEVRVTAPQRDPREGVYRIFGGANGVDVRWDVYLDAASGPDEFSALTDGTWIEGPVSSSVDGTFAGGFQARFYGLPADPLATTRALYLLDFSGPLPARGTTFTATLRTAVGNRPTTTDRVSVVQISGP
jgi:hypothetical protein